MRFFRRNEETLNEQLLREAGLDEPRSESAAAPVQPASPMPELGPTPVVPGSPFAYDDTLLVANAPGIAGGGVQFVALPNGDLIVETEQGDADLSPLADAVERNVAPPYRAVCTREHGDVWGIVAKALDVREFACATGDDIQIVSRGGETSVTVDGSPSDLRIPQLEQDGDCAVHAARIDGDFWEVEAHPL